MSRMHLLVTLMMFVVSVGVSQDNLGEHGGPKQPRRGLKEPILRISKARVENNIPPRTEAVAAPDPRPPHPLDPSISMARAGLKRIQETVTDYSCTMVKQERIDGELLPMEYMYTEIRNRKMENGRIVTPFSVYMYFLKPDNMKGREVIYVENANDGKLVAQEGSGVLRKLGAVKLDPRGPIAMRGNRYPITDIGIEFLVSELIKRGERDRQRDECTAEVKEGLKINNRPCRMLEVIHPVARPYFDFHIARVYIDEAFDLPVRYEAYTWPVTPGGKPELQECYTYLNLKLNVGLTDESFDPKRFGK